MKNVFFIAAALTLNACSVMNKDFNNYGKNYKKISLHMISVGNDKQQVVSTIGAPRSVIGSKRFDTGIVEVWAYEWWISKIGLDEKEEYWLYFLNGKLEQWGRPGDWAREADRIYEVRIR